MKVRLNTYRLTEVNGNYHDLAEALRINAMLHSVVGNREQFYMPGRKVTLQLRREDHKTFLDVTRTSLFEPKYVKSIVDQLGGEWNGSMISGVCPDETVKMFAGKK